MQPVNHYGLFGREQRFLQLVYVLLLSACLERVFALAHVFAHSVLGVTLEVGEGIRLSIFLVMVSLLFLASVRARVLPRLCEYLGSRDECLWFLGSLFWTNIVGMILDRQVARFVLFGSVNFFVHFIAMIAYSYLLYVLFAKVTERYRKWKRVHGGDDWDH